MDNKNEGKTATFDVGDNVFARVKGHPAWPAVVHSIVDPSSKKRKYEVIFYGSEQKATCNAEALFHYHLFKDKFGTQNLRSKHFNKALELIAEADSKGQNKQGSKDSAVDKNTDNNSNEKTVDEDAGESINKTDDKETEVTGKDAESSAKSPARRSAFNKRTIEKGNELKSQAKRPKIDSDNDGSKGKNEENIGSNGKTDASESDDQLKPDDDVTVKQKKKKPKPVQYSRKVFKARTLYGVDPRIRLERIREVELRAKEEKERAEAKESAKKAETSEASSMKNGVVEKPKDVKMKRGKKDAKAFQNGDNVFAKVRGHSPWPAVVTSPAGNKKYSVRFYGTSQTAVCKVSDIYHYKAYKDKHGIPKNKTKGFQVALSEIAKVAETFSSEPESSSQS